MAPGYLSENDSEMDFATAEEGELQTPLSPHATSDGDESMTMWVDTGPPLFVQLVASVKSLFGQPIRTLPVCLSKSIFLLSTSDLWLLASATATSGVYTGLKLCPGLSLSPTDMKWTCSRPRRDFKGTHARNWILQICVMNDEAVDGWLIKKWLLNRWAQGMFWGGWANRSYKHWRYLGLLLPNITHSWTREWAWWLKLRFWGT